MTNRTGHSLEQRRTLARVHFSRLMRPVWKDSALEYMSTTGYIQRLQHVLHKSDIQFYSIFCFHLSQYVFFSE